MQTETIVVDPLEAFGLDYTSGNYVVSRNTLSSALETCSEAKNALGLLGRAEYNEIFSSIDAGTTLQVQDYEGADVFLFATMSSQVLCAIEQVNLRPTGFPSVHLRITNPSDKLTHAYITEDIFKEYWSALEAIMALKGFIQHSKTPAGLYKKYLSQLIGVMPKIMTALSKAKNQRYKA